MVERGQGSGRSRRQCGDGLEPAGLAGRALEDVEAGQPQEPLLPGVGEWLGDRFGHRDAEVIAAEGEEAPAVAMGEKAEVAAADEAIGKGGPRLFWAGGAATKGGVAR
jgi:hypothetical protein